MIRLSETDYQRLVEISTDLIVVHCEGKVVFVNPAAVRLLGARSPEELLGKPALELVHPDDREMVRQRIAQMYETGRAVPVVEERLVRLDGSIIGVEVAAVPTIYEGKSAVQVVARDITERKRVEQELIRRNKQLSVLNTISTAISTSLDVKEIMEILSQQLVEQMDFKTVFVEEYNEHQKVTRLIAIYPKDSLMYSTMEKLGLDVNNVVVPFRGEENRVHAQLLEGKDWMGDDFAEITTPYIPAPLARLAQKLYAVQSIHYVPIMSKGRLVGTIIVGSVRPAISEEERSIVLSVAQEVAPAIENARLLAQVQQESTHRASLMEVTNAINSAVELEKLLDLIVEKVLQLTHSKHGALFLLDEDDTLRIKASRGLSDETVRSLRFKKGEGIAGWVAETGKGVLIHDVQTHPRFKEVAQIERLFSIITVPLIVEGKVVGVLGVDRFEGELRFTEEEFRIAQDFAGQASLALARAKLFDRLQASERKYRQLFEDVPAGVFQSTPDGRVLAANPALIKILGYDSEKELQAVDIGQDLYVNPEERKISRRKLEEQGVLQNVEQRLKRKDGQHVTVLENSRVVRDEHGAVLYYEGTLIDITERKRVEQEREVLYAIGEAVNTTASLDELLQVIHHNIKKVMYAENCYIALYDASTETVSFPFFVDQFDPTPAPRAKRRGLTEYVLRSAKPLLLTPELLDELVRNDEIEIFGTLPESWLGVPLFIQSVPIGVIVVQSYEPGQKYTERDKKLLLAIGNQAAFAIERKRAEEALRKSEEHFRNLVENINDIYYICDQEGRLTYGSPNLFTRTGYTREEIIGRSYVRLIHASDRRRVVDFYNRAAREGGKDVRIELLARLKDGTTVWVEQSTRILRDEQGNVLEYRTVVRDITERKGAEEALRNSETTYRGIINSLSEAIYIQDREGRFVDVNEGAVKMYGYDREFFIGKTPASLSAPGKNDMAMVAKAIEKAFNGEPQEFEFWGLHKDGAVFPKEVRLYPGKYFGEDVVIAVARDITERKQADEALRQSEERFRMVALQTCQLIYDYDIPTGSIVWSGAIESVTGYSSEEFSAVNIDRWAEMIHPEDRQPALDLLNKAIGSASEYKIEYRFQRKDGSYITVADRGGFMVDAGGKAYRMLGTMSDITERKRAELERQTMFEIIQGVTITANLDELLKLIHGTLKKVIYAENYFIALYDYKTGLFSFPYFVDQFDKAPTPKKLEKSCTAYVFRTGRPMLITEEIFQQLVEQGEVELVGTPSPSWLGVPLRTPSETIGVQVVQHYRDGHAYSQRDVEFFASVGSQIALAIERKRAEEATRQSEEKYRSLFEESKDVIFISNPDGRLLDINPVGVELFGYASKEELLGVDIARDLYWDPGKRDESLRLMHQQGYIQDLELEMRRKDGRKLFVLETATVVRDNDGNPIAYRGFLKDITAKRILEEQLRQAQKMESLGTLVGGIAHDFNNILGIIMGHASLLERREIDPEKLLKRIEAIRKASERGANLVQQMLTFARKRDTRTESVRVNDIVRELVKLLEETFPKTITFSLELEENLPSIHADPDQIQQALLNLSLNARDAILLASPRGQSGGTLSFRTKAVSGSAVRRIFQEAREESYLRISVADTGIGMDEKTKSRLFEPFFTTKERGKGTGLGLAVVYGIVKVHHGFIDVESEFGRGTTFHLYFPVPQRNIDVFKTPTEEVEKVEGGTETILVVEDEELLLDIVRNLLEDKGYRVMTASDGIGAVEVYRDHKDQIDLVLMDIGLPGLEGREVLTNLKEVNPNVLVILASGYIDPQMKSELLKAGAKHFVQKPYVPAEILKCIRDVIRGSKV